MSAKIINITDFKRDWRYKDMNKLMDSFMNNHENGFIEYFEEQRKKYLVDRDDYQDLLEQIDDIMEKYPKVQNFFENGENVNMNTEEKDYLLTVIDLQETVVGLELKECFKLGFKEAYIFFKEMDMLNV